MFRKLLSKFSLLLLVILVLGSLVGCKSSTPSSTPSNNSDTTVNSEPIKIGVPLPLTGNLAETGQRILKGIEFVTEEYNTKGGVLGRQIKLVVEDTMGEINTASEVAEKLITKDEVFAIVGGYGSTVDYGMLQSIQSYEPLFVHSGSSTVKIENDFGDKPWYFHLFIWDYHRQQALANALKSLNPVPSTIAILYEDGVYGTTSYEYAKKYLEEAGIEIVLAEAFKSGSADFSGVLNKVKSANPDILYAVGYANDNISIPRQAANLDIDTDLQIIVGLGNVREDFGDFGDGLAYIDTWSVKSSVEGLPEWIEKMGNYIDGAAVTSTHAQGYASMSMLLESIEKTGKLDKDATIEVLSTEEFWTPFGTRAFGKSEKAIHQFLNEDTMLLIQYQGDGEEVVYPDKFASGEIVYPVK